MTYEVRFRGHAITDEGKRKYYCIDPVMLEAQDNLLGLMLTKILKHVAMGKSLGSICLSASISEARTMVDRVVDYWGYAPHYLNEAAKNPDPLAKMKAVVTVCLAGLHSGQGF